MGAGDCWKEVQGMSRKELLLNCAVLIFFILLCVGGGLIFFTQVADDGFGSDSEWFSNLTKTGFDPPAAAYAPVWTILYLLMAIAAFFVWRETGFCDKPIPLVVFFASLVLNFAWILIFGVAKSLLWSSIEILVLWGSIVATMYLFYKVKKWTVLLLVPYLLWVTFATILNWTLWEKNQDNPYA